MGATDEGGRPRKFTNEIASHGRNRKQVAVIVAPGENLHHWDNGAELARMKSYIHDLASCG